MTIFDVRIMDFTAKSYQDGTTTANLQKRENLKKKKNEGLPGGPPQFHTADLQRRGMHGEGDKCSSQTTGSTPKQ